MRAWCSIRWVSELGWTFAFGVGACGLQVGLRFGLDFSVLGQRARRRVHESVSANMMSTDAPSRVSSSGFVVFDSISVVSYSLSDPGLRFDRSPFGVWWLVWDCFGEAFQEPRGPD